MILFSLCILINLGFVFYKMLCIVIQDFAVVKINISLFLFISLVTIKFTP